MLVIEHSETFHKKDTKDNENIYLIQQFFVHSNKERHNEIKKCLLQNLKNEYINKIILLNERIYTDEEMYINKLEFIKLKFKIEQVVISKRLEYKDVFKYVREEKLNGYVIFSNSDIYLDNTIDKLHYSYLKDVKSMLTLLRYDVDKHLNTPKIFGPRADSQDTWIFHSKYNIENEKEKIFNFQFGMPGCDNKFCYLIKILGYKLINCPSIIHTFHLHNVNIRDYNSKDLINNPYLTIIPYDYNKLNLITNNYTKYTFKDNDVLRIYIENKLLNSENFIIPRIAGVENNFAYVSQLLKESYITNKFNEIEYYINILKKMLYTMKNNAGINCTSIKSCIDYSDEYLKAFNNCDIFLEWEKHGDVYKYISNSHDYITTKYKSKKALWAFTMDIFHYIYNEPWTLALKGKRILVISPFIESMKEKLDIRKEIYGIDLFPECKFIFMKPPVTNGMNESEEFIEELNEVIKQIEEIKESFDIALVSCGGYGNLMCNRIYEMGKSAIYVGGVLQMYFGIYGNRWLRERKDIMLLYLNKYWSRPKENEKPKSFEKVEGSCYW